MTNLKTKDIPRFSFPKHHKSTCSPISVVRTTGLSRGEGRLLWAFAQAVTSMLPGWAGGWQAATVGLGSPTGQGAMSAARVASWEGAGMVGEAVLEAEEMICLQRKAEDGGQAYWKILWAQGMPYTNRKALEQSTWQPPGPAHPVQDALGGERLSQQCSGYSNPCGPWGFCPSKTLRASCVGSRFPKTTYPKSGHIVWLKSFVWYEKGA